VQVLRALTREPGPNATRAAELLASLEAGDATASDGHGDAERVTHRFQLLDEISRLLLDSAAKQPLLCWIDDLHWADPGTLALLEFIAPELAKAPLLVLTTVRDEPTTSERDRAMHRLTRHAQRLRLSQLSVEEVERWLGGVSEPATAAALAQAMHHATSGNPLFVHETLLALNAEHGKDGLTRVDPKQLRVPEAARDVLRERLAAVDPEVREMLGHASVLGESIELPVLATIAEHGDDELIELLDRAERAGLLVADSPAVYRFSHELMRAVLYDDLPANERVRKHRAAAEALEGSAKDPMRLGEIARHYYLSLPAGGHARIVDCTVRAAEARLRVHAYEDAVTFYSWALEAQAFDPNTDARARTQLLLALGRTQRLAGRSDDSRASLQRAIELASQHGISDVLLQAAMALRPTMGVAGVADELARGALEEVLRSVPEGATPPRVRALSHLSWIPPYSRDMDKSKELSGRAVELARQLDDHRSLFEALRARLYALSGPDDIDACIEVANEILALERSRRTTWASGEAWSAMCYACLLRADIEGADRALSAIGTLSRELRWPEALWFYDRQLAQQAFLEGRLDEAQRRYDEAQKQAARIGLDYGRIFYVAQRALIVLEREGPEPLIDWVQDAVDPEGPIQPRELPPDALTHWHPARLVRARATRARRARAQRLRQHSARHQLPACARASRTHGRQARRQEGERRTLRAHDPVPRLQHARRRGLVAGVGRVPSGAAGGGARSRRRRRGALRGGPRRQHAVAHATAGRTRPAGARQVAGPARSGNGRQASP
jgi:hypothetical protein